MLGRLLAATRYFDRPTELRDQLLLQLHRFALDFYQGYQVREQSFELRGGELFIGGEASLGERQTRFETRAARGRPVRITFQDPAR
jgi:hypothetical protein